MVSTVSDNFYRPNYHLRTFNFHFISVDHQITVESYDQKRDTILVTKTWESHALIHWVVFGMFYHMFTYFITLICLCTLHTHTHTHTKFVFLQICKTSTLLSVSRANIRNRIDKCVWKQMPSDFMAVSCFFFFFSLLFSDISFNEVHRNRMSIDISTGIHAKADKTRQRQRSQSRNRNWLKKSRK